LFLVGRFAHPRNRDPEGLVLDAGAHSLPLGYILSGIIFDSPKLENYMPEERLVYEMVNGRLIDAA